MAEGIGSMPFGPERHVIQGERFDQSVHSLNLTTEPPRDSRPGVSGADQTGHGHAILCDHHLIPPGHTGEEAGEVGFGFVDVYGGRHRERLV